MRTIGTCSYCHGRVAIPSAWLGIYPPTPTCQKCGARAAPSFGPLIPMLAPTPAVERIVDLDTKITSP